MKNKLKKFNRNLTVFATKYSTLISLQEEEKQTVKVRTEEVPIKNIYIEDKTGRAKITLWREASSTDARPGDFVEITDLLARTYQDCTSLSTTQRSIVKVFIFT
jgi:ssDNA-binding replication factor A large subunit